MSLFILFSICAIYLTLSLEELSEEMERSEKRLHYWEDQEKILRHRVSELTRRERTNRLCIRAGMLESFWEKPEQLRNDQVMELLKVAFRQPEVIQTLKEILKSEAVIKDPLE